MKDYADTFLLLFYIFGFIRSKPYNNCTVFVGLRHPEEVDSPRERPPNCLSLCHFELGITTHQRHPSSRYY